jgi:NAD(P)H dehydrogenase (quinone)
MKKILITGASGQLGREVVSLLLQKVSPVDVAVFVRDPLKVSEFKALGVEIRQGDYNDYNSLVSAFKEVDKLYFVSGSDVMNRLKQHENVVGAAKEAGVKHIIYTSFQRKIEDSSSPIAMVAEAHIKTEALIKASGLTYTILKHALYADVIPMFAGDKVIETGTIYIPAGDGKVSYINHADLAEGAVAILTSNGHENKTYEFSGTQSYSFTEIAAILSKLSGKTITYISPSIQDFKDTLTKVGVPAGIIGMTTSFSEGIKQGEFDFPDATLSKLIGRKTFDMTDFLRDIYSKR